MKSFAPSADNSQSHIFELETKFCIEKLKSATETLMKEWDLSQSYNQFCFTHRDIDLSDNDKVLDGCGSLFYKWSPIGEEPKFDDLGNLHKKNELVSEIEFKIFNEKYKNTYFYIIYKEICSVFKNVGRMRLMCLWPQNCYSWHYDTSDRLHIPIFSNEKCQFIIDGKSYFLPPNGNSYLCKTRNYHTAFNADPKLLRVNIVIDIIE